MTILRWTLDSCPCVIRFDPATETFDDYEARCDEHRTLQNQALYDGVKAHNNSFNNQYSVGPTPTEQELEDEANRITGLKIAEAARIRANGPTERRTPGPP